MTEYERIIAFFLTLGTRSEQVAYIIALELSGKNIEANRCKAIIERGELR